VGHEADVGVLVADGLDQRRDRDPGRLAVAAERERGRTPDEAVVVVFQRVHERVRGARRRMAREHHRGAVALLDGFAGQFTNCPSESVDIAQCAADGTIDRSDILAVLDAFAGDDPCCGQ